MRTVRYHRRGHAGSSDAPEQFSVARQAADAVDLLSGLGIRRAHVAAHSFGGAVALQLALDAPDLVRSLVLFGPALAIGEGLDSYYGSLRSAIQRYREVGAEGVVRDFLLARWPAYEIHLQEALPGGFEQAAASAQITFEIELPGLLEWRFDDVAAARIAGLPLLSVLGGDSPKLSPRFQEAHDYLLTRFSDSEALVVPQTTHFMQLEKPSDIALALLDFFQRKA